MNLNQIVPLKFDSETNKRKFLALGNKIPQLSSLGTKVDDNYYSEYDSQVNLVEVVKQQGMYQQSLSNKSFGSQNQVLLNNVGFIGDIYLYLKLPANIFVGQGTKYLLPRGWGISVIRSLSWTLGDSNIQQQTIDKWGIFCHMLATSQTAEKSTYAFDQAGVGTLNEAVGGSGIQYRNTDYAVLQFEAVVKLPTPWSNMSGGQKKTKWFPADCLTSPISLDIGFEELYKILGWAAGTYDLNVSGFADARLLITQGFLTDRAMSLKYDLMRDRGLMYAYPFVATQTTSSVVFKGSQPGNPKITLNLSQFLNADLLGIAVLVLNRASEGASGKAATIMTNWFDMDLISDVDLSLNNQPLFSAPGTSWISLGQESTIGAVYVNNPYYIAQGGAWTAFANETRPLIIEFQRTRDFAFNGTLGNSLRVGNQIMTLSFNTSLADPVEYVAHFTYFYNAVAQLQDGYSTIFY